MPLYSYKHDCGMEQRFFLNEDVNTKLIDCYGCGRKVTARQVRDPRLKIGEADGVKGVLERNDPKQKPKADGR